MVKKAIKPKPKTASKKKSTLKTAVSLTPVSDKQWQIESDARTLKQAMEIKGDPSRMKAAQEYCTKEMEALKKVSKMKG